MEPTYSIKEIMELQFKGMDHKLDTIVSTLKEQTAQTDKQFLRLDKEIADLKVQVAELRETNARYKTIWGIGATLGASVVAYTLNKIF